MSLIRETLIQIRQELGFESAKAFYRFLEERRPLEFNYAHYMKIEGAKALPSSAMVAAIGSALEPKYTDRLILAYCETLFPNQRHLFKAAKIQQQPPAPPQSGEAGTPGATLIKQQFLTEAQVATICRSFVHYAVFLILTLARGGISPEELAALFKVSSEELRRASADLEKARLTRSDGSRIASIAKEMRFPKAETESIRKMYHQIDLWNFDLDQRIGLENVLQKMMIRRVSARYLGVIVSHCNVLMDLIRAAEEIHPEYNDDVLFLNLTLSRGRLPG